MQRWFRFFFVLFGLVIYLSFYLGQKYGDTFYPTADRRLSTGIGGQLKDGCQSECFSRHKFPFV